MADQFNPNEVLALMSSVADAVRMLKDFYDGCIAVGFDKHESLQLTIAMMQSAGKVEKK